MNGIFLVFAFLVVMGTAFAQPPPPPPEIKAMFDGCKTEIGITEGPRPDDEDPKAKCFLACLLKKMGQMADGKVLLDKGLEIAAKVIPDFDDAKKAAVTECVNKANAESDECEAAFVLSKCAKENGIASPHHPHPPMH